MYALEYVQNAAKKCGGDFTIYDKKSAVFFSKAGAEKFASWLADKGIVRNFQAATRSRGFIYSVDFSEAKNVR
jgi:hypothetical protein